MAWHPDLKHSILLCIWFLFLLNCSETRQYTTKPQRIYLDRKLLFAHRGASGHEVENTLKAFQTALKQGANVLETDVRITQDRAVVIFHDLNAERLTGIDKEIREMKLNEFKNLTLYANQKQAAPLTLEEAFINFPGVRINIEVKDTEDPDIAKNLYNLIKKYDRKNLVLVGSADSDWNASFRKISNREIATGAGMADVIDFYFCYLFTMKCNFEYDALQIPPTAMISLSTVELIEYAHSRGLSVHYWTINDPQQARRLLERGADGIMTDYPDRIWKE